MQWAAKNPRCPCCKGPLDFISGQECEDGSFDYCESDEDYDYYEEDYEYEDPASYSRKYGLYNTKQ